MSFIKASLLSLSLTTNKTTYVPGETVDIAVKTVPFCRTTVSITDPAKSTAMIIVLRRKIRIQDQASFTIPTDAPLGIWTIAARAVCFLRELGKGQTTFMVAIAI